MQNIKCILFFPTLYFVEVLDDTSRYSMKFLSLRWVKSQPRGNKLNKGKALVFCLPVTVTHLRARQRTNWHFFTKSQIVLWNFRNLKFKGQRSEGCFSCPSKRFMRLTRSCSCSVYLVSAGGCGMVLRGLGRGMDSAGCGGKSEHLYSKGVHSSLRDFSLFSQGRSHRRRARGVR